MLGNAAYSRSVGVDKAKSLCRRIQERKRAMGRIIYLVENGRLAPLQIGVSRGLAAAHRRAKERQIALVEKIRCARHKSQVGSHQSIISDSTSPRLPPIGFHHILIARATAGIVGTAEPWCPAGTDLRICACSVAPSGARQTKALDSERPEKGLVHDPAPLQPARTVLHERVAAERDR